jgi:hypothetical protein
MSSTELTAAARPAHRPIVFPPEVIWPPILEALANGLSLSEVLRCPGMPSMDWCMRQIRDSTELKQRYRDAVESRGAVLADQILELADSKIPDDLDGPSRAAWVGNKRLALDARKWLACRLFPKQYADRMEVETNSYQSISITAAMKRGEARGIEMTERILAEFRKDQGTMQPLDVEARTVDVPDDDDESGDEKNT